MGAVSGDDHLSIRKLEIRDQRRNRLLDGHGKTGETMRRRKVIRHAGHRSGRDRQSETHCAVAHQPYASRPIAFPEIFEARNLR